ncbi:hypothetical protein ABT352_13575 [Streptosporangium sp. NPDC000563]|uniref:hypothetical protein n=1 Tax=Streptosporangium sp. NPDC000563 TaxID=3154366 RepID=UPI0033196B9F
MPPVSIGRVGYIDESIHDRPGLYLLAVVLAEPDASAQVGRELSALIPAARRVHWHAEDDLTRIGLVKTVSTMPVSARVYSCGFDAPGRKEAARARALSWMALELDTGVRHLVLDRRQNAQNAVDRRVLGGLAGRPPRFTMDHRSSADEPLLWLADIVVGAAAAQVLGRTSVYTELLGEVLRSVSVDRPEKSD